MSGVSPWTITATDVVGWLVQGVGIFLAVRISQAGWRRAAEAERDVQVQAERKFITRLLRALLPNIYAYARGVHSSLGSELSLVPRLLLTAYDGLYSGYREHWPKVASLEHEPTADFIFDFFDRLGWLRAELEWHADDSHGSKLSGPARTHADMRKDWERVIADVHLICAAMKISLPPEADVVYSAAPEPPTSKPG